MKAVETGAAASTEIRLDFEGRTHRKRSVTVTDKGLREA